MAKSIVLYHCHCILFFIAISLNQYVLISGQNWLLDYLLPEDYNNTLTPLPEGMQYLQVNASVKMTRFHVPHDQESVEAHLFVCIRWYDYRIRNLNISVWDSINNQTDYVNYQRVKLTEFNRLWIPKVDFRNGDTISTVNTMTDIRFLEVWPEMKLLNSCAYISGNFRCDMKLSSYPFDEQFCYFELETVQNTWQHLYLYMQSFWAIQGNQQFRVNDAYTGRCDILEGHEEFEQVPRNETSIEGESCAFAGLRMGRHLSYYILRYYCITFLTAMLGQCTVYIPTNTWPARIILSATVELTVIQVSITAYNRTPARDVVSLFWWLWGIQCMIYFYMAEFALALAWYQFVIEKKQFHAENRETPDGHYFGKNGWYKAAGQRWERVLHFFFGPIDFFFDPINRNKVDYSFRLIFPVMLGTFVVTYIIVTIPAWVKKYDYCTHRHC